MFILSFWNWGYLSYLDGILYWLLVVKAEEFMMKLPNKLLDLEWLLLLLNLFNFFVNRFRIFSCSPCLNLKLTREPFSAVATTVGVMILYLIGSLNPLLCEWQWEEVDRLSPSRIIREKSDKIEGVRLVFEESDRASLYSGTSSNYPVNFLSFIFRSKSSTLLILIVSCLFINWSLGDLLYDSLLSSRLESFDLGESL